MGDLGLTPALGRSPGGGHGNPLQYSCLENGQRSLMGHRVGHNWVNKHSTAQLTCYVHSDALWFSHIESFHFHVSLQIGNITLSWMARRLEGCIKTLYPRLVIPLTCRGARGARLSQAFTSSRLKAITALWWSPLERLGPSLPSLVLDTRSILKPGDCKDTVRAGRWKAGGLTGQFWSPEKSAVKPNQPRWWQIQGAEGRGETWMPLQCSFTQPKLNFHKQR